MDMKTFTIKWYTFSGIITSFPPFAHSTNSASNNTTTIMECDTRTECLMDSMDLRALLNRIIKRASIYNSLDNISRSVTPQLIDAQGKTNGTITNDLKQILNITKYRQYLRSSRIHVQYDRK